MVLDEGNGWYSVSYTLHKAGPFTVALGLDGVYGASDFSGICQAAVCDPAECTIGRLQLEHVVLLAGQQAQLQIGRADRQVSSASYSSATPMLKDILCTSEGDNILF